MMFHRRIKLTDKRQNWLGKRSTVLHGKPLLYNVGEQEAYYHAIYKLFRKMANETKHRIGILFQSRAASKFKKQQKSVLTQDASDNVSVQAKQIMRELVTKFEKMFYSSADDIAKNMWRDALKTSDRTLKESLKQLTGGLTLKTSVIPKGLETISKAVIAENVNYIKTVPEQYLRKVEGAVMRSITNGAGVQNVIDEVTKYSAQSQRHIKNLAYDQTRKAYNSINKQRMMAVGIGKYIWRHSGGGMEPREDHIAMDGEIFSFDEPPVIDERTGERGIPGQAINCGCTMEPVLEFENGKDA